MRWHIVEIFKKELLPLHANLSDIGIVGGHINEPELSGLDSKQFTFYGVEPDQRVETIHFDLNNPQDLNNQHDLVLCSQVLEHVYDVKQSIENLANLVRLGGYLWIACPTSNYPHGSPDYFSAGYTPKLIANLLRPHGFEILHASQYGSERMYFFTHALRYWPTRAEYQFPLRVEISRYLFRDLFWRMLAIFKSSKFDSELHHATETVVFAKKIKRS